MRTDESQVSMNMKIFHSLVYLKYSHIEAIQDLCLLLLQRLKIWLIKDWLLLSIQQDLKESFESGIFMIKEVMVSQRMAKTTVWVYGLGIRTSPYGNLFILQ